GTILTRWRRKAGQVRGGGKRDRRRKAGQAESGTGGKRESGTEAGKRDRYGSGKAGQKRESGTGTILTRWGVLGYASVMPRTARVAPGGMVFHVLNRGVARMQLFEKAADYQAFEQVLRDTLDQSP